MIGVTVKNVPCSGVIDPPINMDDAAGLPGVVWEPTTFPGMKMRLDGCTILLFKSGKTVSVGAKSVEIGLKSLDSLVGFLGGHGIKVAMKDTAVTNVVCTADYGGKLLLGEIAMKVGHGMYEPEHFPGAIIRRQNPKCVILLFSSGKVVCVGAKTVEDASNAINILHADLVKLGLA